MLHHLFTVPVWRSSLSGLGAEQEEVKRIVLTKYSEFEGSGPQTAGWDANNRFFGFQENGDAAWIKVSASTHVP